MDDVIITVNVTSNSGTAASVKSITVNGDVHVDIPITVSATGAIFNNASRNTNTITGNVTYNNTSYNGGTVTGNVIFNYVSGGIITLNNGQVWGIITGTVKGSDAVSITSWIFNGNSYVIGGSTITGSPTFNNTTYNAGTITGNPIFNTSSYNTNIINGSPTFNNTTYNAGTITGNPIFNDTSKSNLGSIISGNPIFYNLSYEKGVIVGNPIFHNSSSSGLNDGVLGTLITGNATFYDESIDFCSINGDVVFNDKSYPFHNYISGNVIFNSQSYNNGIITGNAVFNDLSYNNHTVIGTATFNYAHAGIITIADGGQWGFGNATAIVGDDSVPITSWIFNGASVNHGQITGNTTFNNTSYNQNFYDSTITGNSIFNDTSYNNGTITGTATFNYGHGGVITIADSGQWGSGTATSNVGDDTLPITSWIFNGYGYNSGSITGDATFNDNSVNYGGTITGNPIFNNSSYNAGSILGNSIFKDSSSNGSDSGSTGTISSDAIFLDTTTNYLGSTISGNACFVSTATNSGTVTGITSVCTAPVLTTLSPTSIALGNTSFPLTATGTDFLFNSIVKWNDDILDTTLISPTELLATVPASKILALGTPSITVYSPTLLATSGSQTFNIVNPTPVTTTLSPSSITAGTPVFTLTVTGTDFISTSVINWNGTPLTTTYVSDTQLTTDISANDISIANTKDITVTNPTPGGGTSNTQVFTIHPIQGNGPLVSYTPPVVTPPVIIPPVVTPVIPPTEVITPTLTTPTPQTYNLGTTTLKNGSKGEAVKELQRLLNKLLNLNLIIDGKLGPKTIAVIKKWQKAHGLTPDGLVGKKTREKMMGE